MDFSLIIKLIILGIGLLGTISYMAMRRRQKTTLKQTLSYEPGRQLIQEEYEGQTADREFLQKIATSCCDIIQQRDESEIEQKMHNCNNSGFLSVLFLIIGVIFTLLFIDEGPNENNTIFLIIGCLSALLSLFFYSKKSKPTEDKVNQIKGTLIAKDSIDNQIIVGDGLRVNYPDYWEARIPESSASDVDIDICIASHSLIRFGHTLSIAKEIEAYGAPRFWGRNCLLAITGIILFFIVSNFSYSVKDNFIYTYSILTSDTQPIIITDRNQLSKQSLAIGDWVDIKAVGQCDIDDLYHCYTIKVHHQAISPTDDSVVVASDWAHKALQNKLVNVVKDSQTDMYETLANGLNVYGSRSVYNSYNRVSFSKVKNISSLVLLVNRLCQDTTSLDSLSPRVYSCNMLKTTIFGLLNTGDIENGKNRNFSNWNELAVSITEERTPVDVVAYTDTANQVGRLFKQLSSSYIEELEYSYFKLAKAYQQKSNITLQVVTTQISPYAILPGLTSRDIHNWSNTTKLAYYMDIVANQADKLFRLKGMVTGLERDESGKNINMLINTDLCSEKDAGIFSPAIISTALLAILALFTVIQFIVWITKVILNQHRIVRIKKALENNTY